jgi:hypothetical protein
MVKVYNLYNSKVLLILLIGLMGLILCPVYVNAAPNPGHSAGEIGAGTFADSSPYTFPQNLIVSGNFGLGASPGSKLDVRGITQITDDSATPDTSTYASFGVTRAAAAQNNAYIGLTKQGTVPWGMGIDSGSSLIFGVATNSPARTIPTPRLTLTQGGNLGIGTTSPSQALDVSGNINFETSALRYLYLGSGSGYLKTGNAAGSGILLEAVNSPGVYINSVSNKPVILATGGGNVGIGAASPSQKLEVAGVAKVANSVGDALKIGGSTVPMGLSTEVGGTGPLLNFDVNFRQSDKNNVYRGMAFRIDTRDSGPAFAWLTRAAGSSTEDVRMILTETGNVGIGTTGPANKLDVEGGAVIGATYSGTNTAPANGLLVEGKVGIGTTAPTGPFQVQLPVWTDRDTDSQHVIFSNSMDVNYGIRFGFTGTGGYGVINVLNPAVGWGNLILQEDGGSVGIGTTSPGTYKLNVAGDTLMGGVALEYTSEINVRPDLESEATLFINYHGTSNSDQFRNTQISDGKSNSILYTKGSTGYVGIGTTSPGAKLEVAGQVKITGGSPGAGKVLTSDASGLASWQTSAGGIGGGGSANYIPKFTAASTLGNSVIYDNGNVGIGTTDPAGYKLRVAGSMRVDSASESVFMSGNTYIHLRPVDGTGTGAYGRIGAFHATEGWKNLLLNDGGGNVGIGTMNPQSKLHVTGDAGVLNLEGSTHAYIQWYPDGSAAGRKGWTGWENGAAIDFTIANEYSGGDIILSPNTNVGIGTTSPGYKLDVSGDIRSTGAVRAGNGGFGFAPNGNSWTGFDLQGAGKRVILGIDASSSDPVFDIEKVDSGWQHMMELRKDGSAYFAGSVGVGTSTPDDKLEVIGSVTSDFADNGGEGAYYFGNTNHGISRNNQNTVSIFTSSGGSEGAIRLNTDGVTRVFVANGSAGDGKVGIGTTSPGSKLHVFGGGNYPALLLVERDGYSGDNRIAAFKGKQVRAVFDGPDGDPVGVGLEFAESGNSMFTTAWNSYNNRFEMYNTSNGNYGIAIYPSVSPANRLDVYGSAHATSFPTSSDIRFKTNITQLTNVLEKVEKIHGVSFEWNKLYESMGRSTGHREIGVIAQEVEAVFPELVTTWGDNNENYKAVDYGRMTGVLVEAVKELKAENDALKQRVEALERGANVKV